VSVRVELSSFSFAKLQMLLGTRNQQVVDDLSASLDKAVAEKKPWALRLGETERAHYLSALSDAVLKGVPLEGVKSERTSHVLLASHLALFDQRHRRIDCGIPREILQDFLEEQGSLFRPAESKLLRHLVSGRPLFGQRIAGGTGYGYLLREETVALRETLERYAQNPKAEEDGVELAEELIECLDQGHSHPSQPDLWISIG
jgi:hypothetical protein